MLARSVVQVETAMPNHSQRLDNCVADITTYLLNLANGTDWALSSKCLLLVYSVFSLVHTTV